MSVANREHNFIKLLIVGRCLAGKKSLVWKFFNDWPTHSEHVDTYSKKLKIYNTLADPGQLLSWKQRPIIEALLHTLIVDEINFSERIHLDELDGLALVYSMTDEKSVQTMIFCYDVYMKSFNRPKNLADYRVPSAQEVSIFIVASKTDEINKQNHENVTKNYERVEEWKKSKGIKHHLITSAKYDINIETTFYQIALEIIKMKSHKQHLPESQSTCIIT